MTAPAVSRLFTRRILLVVYWGVAVFLAPWIVALYLEQPADGVAHHLDLVRFGVSVLTVLGMLGSAAGVLRRSPYAVLYATFTATLVVITGWFSVVTTTGPSFTLSLGYALIVLLPVAVLCVWITWRLTRAPRKRAHPPITAALALGIGAVALLPLAIVLGHGQPATHAAHHLRVVWTGLDTLELVGLMATGWCLWRALPGLTVAAAFTGTLLFCDAWFDVVATTGSVQLAGVVMAFAELPLSALSFAIAGEAAASKPTDRALQGEAALGYEAQPLRFPEGERP
jgi:hypothetical protein